MIKRPQKALSDPIKDNQLHLLSYPMLGSPKMDGVRAMPDGEIVYSASLKPIRNRYIQKCLKNEEYKGLDGELIVGCPFAENEEDDVFNRTSGSVNSFDGNPDFKLHVFDDWRFLDQSYKERWINQINSFPLHEIPFLVVVEQRPLYNPQDIINFTNEMVEKGYEGAMIRNPLSLYKEGRTTFREMNIFKRTVVEIDEAIILSCYEQTENANEAKKNELGLLTRSSSKDNKIPKNTLGGFILKSIKYGWEFRCGTIEGIHADHCKYGKVTTTDGFRKYVWEHQDEFVGKKIASYKFKKIGTLDKPRQPILRGFRHPSDMTDY